MITTVCIELTLRDTKVEFTLSITPDHQSRQVHQSVNQNGNLTANKCRYMPHRMSVAVTGI